MSIALLIIAVMVASAVEMVEAMTVVLATGFTRSWRSSLEGAGVAFVLLAVLVLVFGRALTTWVPLDTLRIFVGVLLLLMGLQWLRKAILRSSGLKEQRDEAAIYQKQTSSLTWEDAKARPRRDATAFTLSFKGVLLEGTEVVFIVVGFGASSGHLGLAALGAIVAAAIVGISAALLARPLARVPENAMKFGVGLLLVSFGTFWVGEGAGVAWPGQDYFIPILLAVNFLCAQGLVQLLTRNILPSRARGAVTDE